MTYDYERARLIIEELRAGAGGKRLDSAHRDELFEDFREAIGLPRKARQEYRQAGRAVDISPSKGLQGWMRR